MAIIYGQNFANGVVLPTVAGSLYAVPAGVVRSIITQARLVNYGATAVAVTLYVLQDGESVTAARQTRIEKSLAAGATELVEELIGDSVEAGGSIQGFASSATSVSISITGTEITS